VEEEFGHGSSMGREGTKKRSVSPRMNTDETRIRQASERQTAGPEESDDEALNLREKADGKRVREQGCPQMTQIEAGNRRESGSVIGSQSPFDVAELIGSASISLLHFHLRSRRRSADRIVSLN
jgi:hypothetical protein